MSAHLINNIFRLRIGLKHKSTKNIYPKDQFAYILHALGCFRRRSYKQLARMNKVASRRIERELDLTYFIRKQLVTSAILHALTTKSQRFLARKNYRVTLSSKAQDPSDENSTTDS
jgi:hypothetical protein